MPFGLADATWRSFLRGVVRGEYRLLLGAGASADARDRSGAALPGASALASDLVRDFSIPAGTEVLSLQRAYERAKNRRDVRGSALSQYLATRFTETSPPDWYGTLCGIRWARLWTLNIDDVVERAYEAYANSAAQRLIPLSWNSPHRDPAYESNEVLLIHLHGRAAESDKGLVFDIVEYFRAGQHQHVWHHIFAGDFEAQPFLVVGARLSDEYDLAEVLRRGNTASQFVGRPSLVVLRSITPLQREELTEWGVTPVEAAADDFFRALDADLPAARGEVADLVPGRSRAIADEAIRFLQQFERLRVDDEYRLDPKHDLYAGHDPEWTDILNESDAVFGLSERVVRDITSSTERRQAVYCLAGSSFSGKSTSLYRIGRELLKRGRDIFIFRQESRLDATAILWWLKRAPTTALLFDGLADSAPELGSLVKDCEAALLPLTVVGTERDTRVRRLYSELPPASLIEPGSFLVGSLSDADIERLLDKLQAARRLGRLTGAARLEQRQHFIQAGRQVFAGMADLEHAAGFVSRIRNQLDAIAAAMGKDAYAVCCLSYALGYPVPVPILCSAIGTSVREFSRAMQTDEALSDAIYVDGRGARPRHRRIASQVVQSALTSDRIFELSTALAIELAPYVTREAIRQRQVPYRIARELMDQTIVTSWVGRDRADKWYESIVRPWDWNARFWEQRALAEAEMAHFDRAESYASHAVKVRKDPFTLNTLGTVLMRKAAEWAAPASEDVAEYYWRAVVSLRESRSLSASEYEHPFVTFFTYSIRCVSNGLQRTSRVQDEWDSWIRDAERSVVFSHRRMVDQLLTFRNEWLRLALMEQTSSSESA